MDLICYSHLRWNFVYQRPQHLLSRFAKKYRVFYIEEPVFADGENHLNISSPSNNIEIVVPTLTHKLSAKEVVLKQRNLLSQLFKEYNIKDAIFWYYTPMALS